MSDRLTVYGWLYYKSYRALMKLAHRFNWHHAPSSRGLTNDAGWPLHICDWCGLRGFVMPPLKPGDLLKPIGRTKAHEASAAPKERDQIAPVP